ncbi:MAG: SMC-Scp complex subunit ScpB [FCB group bacterium]|nr:SMC-Scp complex subunit ScpB [FCB group bacterium]
MQEKEQQLIIEALLFASPEPLTQQQVNLVFESDPPRLKTVVEALREKYEQGGHAFEIIAVAGGYQITSKPEYEVWIRRLLKGSGRLLLSSAALETLAIVAYKQPLSRYEIEAIRGVDCSGVLKTLLSRGLIRIKGRDKGPGRPLLYGTTERFLENFGLAKLSDLPKLKEISELMGSAENQEKFQMGIFSGEASDAPPESEGENLTETTEPDQNGA